MFTRSGSGCDFWLCWRFRILHSRVCRFDMNLFSAWLNSCWDGCVGPAFQAIKLCDRNFGIGGDGVIFALPPVGDTDYTMRIFNSDGSEPEMCGNGIRCLARFIHDLDGGSSTSHKVTFVAQAVKLRCVNQGWSGR